MWVSVTASSATASSSSAAVTVTVCGWSQFVVAKVRLAGLTVRSVPDAPLTVTVTAAVGWESSTTV